MTSAQKHKDCAYLRALHDLRGSCRNPKGSRHKLYIHSKTIGGHVSLKKVMECWFEPSKTWKKIKINNFHHQKNKFLLNLVLLLIRAVTFSVKRNAVKCNEFVLTFRINALNVKNGASILLPN